DGPERTVPRERAQAHDDPDPVQQPQLADQVRDAVVAFLRRGAVPRGTAPVDRGDVGLSKAQAVIPAHRRGLVRQPAPVKGREQEVTGPVAGEDAPRAVPAMRGRRQAQEQDPCRRIGERRHGPPPVRLAGEGGPLLPSHLLPPCHQSGAFSAGHDLVRQGLEPNRTRHAADPTQGRDSLDSGTGERPPTIYPEGSQWPSQFASWSWTTPRAREPCSRRRCRSTAPSRWSARPGAVARPSSKPVTSSQTSCSWTCACPTWTGSPRLVRSSARARPRRSWPSPGRTTPAPSGTC